MSGRPLKARVSSTMPQPQCAAATDQVPPTEIRTAYLTRRGVAPALIAVVAAAAFGEARL